MREGRKRQRRDSYGEAANRGEVMGAMARQ